MLSAALTSFVTGITEPIEFSFMFLAPLLYLAHAVASAGAYFLCVTLEIKHGMTFSHGLIDFILLYSQSSKALWFFVLGPLWAAVYFFGFTFMIRYFDLPTLGRGEASTNSERAEQRTGTPRAEGILTAFGGEKNILQLDACITRLRVRVKDSHLVSEEALKKWGAVHVLKVAEGVQAIFGTESENIKSEIEALLKAPKHTRTETPSKSTTHNELPSEVFSLLEIHPHDITQQTLDPYRTRIEIQSQDLRPFKQLLVGEKGLLVQISPRVVHWVKSSLDS